MPDPSLSSLDEDEDDDSHSKKTSTKKRKKEQNSASPKKKAKAAKGKSGGKSDGGSGKGFQKEYPLSDALAAVVGSVRMSRPQVMTGVSVDCNRKLVPVLSWISRYPLDIRNCDRPASRERTLVNYAFHSHCDLQVVKKLWEYIRENGLQNPKDKRVCAHNPAFMVPLRCLLRKLNSL